MQTDSEEGAAVKEQFATLGESAFLKWWHEQESLGVEWATNNKVFNAPARAAWAAWQAAQAPVLGECEECGHTIVTPLKRFPASVRSETARIDVQVPVCQNCGFAAGATSGVAVSATPLKLSELVPTSWLDPLLTGPSAVFDATGRIEPKHIEALLRRLKQRIQEAEAVNG